MAYVTPDKYSPYPRVCDVCGQLRSIATMRKLDGITWVCDKHVGERTAISLDLLNAHARPPQTWPNKEAKPQNPVYPNTLEADESNTINFLAQQVFNQARYEIIESGDGSPYATDIVGTMGWAAKYAYGLINQGTRPARMIQQAKSILSSAADYLLTRQYGSATGPSPSSTRANDAFFGGVLEPSATTFVTDNTAIAGQALLYAYRVFGTASYIVGARAAASYLRNVQAIGSNGSNYTSSDAGGTARLYTGSLASQVSTASGFYSNSLFYPSALLALEFWKELTTTDGDQSIGATSAVTGFATTPSQLMSTSMTDLRACWTNGIRDADTDVVVGFSATTPREFFNAYPIVKANFSISGSGMWEFADGSAANGTAITSQNYAKALSALYAYEGASTQVTSISDWLRSFTSNAEFETPDNTSTSVLYRTTTGDYDPTVALSTLLTVRDADDDFATIKTNGSSLYDWGALGLLSRLWGSRNATSFRSSRLLPLNIVQRYQDGTQSDGLAYDRIYLRGLSGLTMQTAFALDTDAGDASGPIGYPAGSSVTVTGPIMSGLQLWLKGDAELENTGGLVATPWGDQSGNNNDAPQPTDPALQPLYVANGIDGIPGIDCSGLRRLTNDDAELVANGAPRTVLVVCKPSSIAGGPLFTFRRTTDDHAVYLIHNGAQQFVWSNGPDNREVLTPVNYANQPILVEHVVEAGLQLLRSVNGTNTPLNNPTILAENSTFMGFTVGNRELFPLDGWIGVITEVLVWDRALTSTERGLMRSYIASRYESISISGTATITLRTVNDAIRAAQYGLSYREVH